VQSALPQIDTLIKLDLPLIHYQPLLKMLVCLDCHVGVQSNHAYGHLKNKHGIKISKKRVNEIVSSHNLTIANDASISLRKGPVATIPWLCRPVPGLQCSSCDYCCEKIDTLRKHLSLDHQFEPTGPVTKLPHRNVFMQQLFSKGLGSKFFRVEPKLVNGPPNGVFSRFYCSLDPVWQSGDFLSAISTEDIGSGQDLNQFLRKTGWVNAMSGYSMAKLRRKILHPGESDPVYFRRIPGLGKKLLLTLTDLNHVPHDVLEGLTSWRSKRYSSNSSLLFSY
jgi:hypothetical protein